jgi:divalent metal cation (Fe/Co/Zn/Cd) transporter
MEDTGALIGLVFALAGVILSLVTGDLLWDVYATFGIGVLLVLIAFFVARETKSLLIGEGASPESLAIIEGIVDEAEAIECLMNLRTMQLGEDEFLAALKVQWKPNLTATEIADATNALEARIREAIPRARYLFIETDVYDPERAG